MEERSSLVYGFENKRSFEAITSRTKSFTMTMFEVKPDSETLRNYLSNPSNRLFVSHRDTWGRSKERIDTASVVNSYSRSQVQEIDVGVSGKINHTKLGYYTTKSGEQGFYVGSMNFSRYGPGEAVNPKNKGFFTGPDQTQANYYVSGTNSKIAAEVKSQIDRIVVDKLPMISTEHLKVISPGDREGLNSVYRDIDNAKSISILGTTLTDPALIDRLVRAVKSGKPVTVVTGGTSINQVAGNDKTASVFEKLQKDYPNLLFARAIRPSHANLIVTDKVGYTGDMRPSKNMAKGVQTMLMFRHNDAKYMADIKKTINELGGFAKVKAEAVQKNVSQNISLTFGRYGTMMEAVMPRVAASPKGVSGIPWQYVIDPNVVYDREFEYKVMFLSSSKDFYAQYMNVKRKDFEKLTLDNGKVVYAPKHYGSGIATALYRRIHEAWNGGAPLPFDKLPKEIRAADVLMQSPSASYELRAKLVNAARYFGADKETLQTINILSEQRGNRGILESLVVNAGRWLDHHSYTTRMDQFMYSGGYRPNEPGKSEIFTDTARYLADASTNFGMFLIAYYHTHFMHSVFAKGGDYVVRGTRTLEQFGASAATRNRAFVPLNTALRGTTWAARVTRDASLAVARATFNTVVFPVVEALMPHQASSTFYNKIMDALEHPAFVAARKAADPTAGTYTPGQRAHKIVDAASEMSGSMPFVDFFQEDATMHDTPDKSRAAMARRDANRALRNTIGNIFGRRFTEVAGSFSDYRTYLRQASIHSRNAAAKSALFAELSAEKIGLRQAIAGFAVYHGVSFLMGEALASKPFVLRQQVETEKKLNTALAGGQEDRISYASFNYLLPRALHEVPMTTMAIPAYGAALPMQVISNQSTASNVVAALAGFAVGAHMRAYGKLPGLFGGLVAGAAAGLLAEVVQGRGLESYRSAREILSVPLTVTAGADERRAIRFNYRPGFDRGTGPVGLLRGIWNYLSDTTATFVKNSMRQLEAERDQVAPKVLTQGQAAAMTAADKLSQYEQDILQSMLPASQRSLEDQDKIVDLQSRIQQSLDKFINFETIYTKSTITKITTRGLRIGWMGTFATYFNATTQGGKTDFGFSIITQLPFQLTFSGKFPVYYQDKRGYRQFDTWYQSGAKDGTLFEKSIYSAVNATGGVNGSIGRLAQQVMSVGFEPNTLFEAPLALGVGFVGLVGPSVGAVAAASTFAIAARAAEAHYKQIKVTNRGSTLRNIVGYLKYGESPRVSFNPLTNLGHARTREPHTFLRRIPGAVMRFAGSVANIPALVASAPITLPVAAAGRIHQGISLIRGGAFNYRTSGYAVFNRGTRGVASAMLVATIIRAGYIVHDVRLGKTDGYDSNAYIDRQISRFVVNVKDSSSVLGALAQHYNVAYRSFMRRLLNLNVGVSKHSEAKLMVIGSPLTSIASEMSPIVGKYGATIDGNNRRILDGLKKIGQGFSSENVFQSFEVVVGQHGFAFAAQKGRDEDTITVDRTKGRVSLGFGGIFTVSFNTVYSPLKAPATKETATALALATVGKPSLIMYASIDRKPAFMGRMFSSSSPVYNFSPSLKLAIRNRQMMSRYALGAWGAEFKQYTGGYVGGFLRSSKQSYYTQYTLGKFDSENNLVSNQMVINSLRSILGVPFNDSYAKSIAVKFSQFYQTQLKKAYDADYLKELTFNAGGFYNMLMGQRPNNTTAALQAYFTAARNMSSEAGAPVSEVDDNADILYGNNAFSLEQSTLRTGSRITTAEEALLGFYNMGSGSAKVMGSLIASVHLGFFAAVVGVGAGLAARSIYKNYHRDTLVRIRQRVYDNTLAEDTLKGFDSTRKVKGVFHRGIVPKVDGTTQIIADAFLVEVPQPGRNPSLLLGAKDGSPIGATSNITSQARARGYSGLARTVIEAYSDIGDLTLKPDTSRTLSNIRTLRQVLHTFAGYGPGGIAPPPGWKPSKQYLRAMKDLADIERDLMGGGDYAKNLNRLEKTLYYTWKNIHGVLGLGIADRLKFIYASGLSNFGAINTLFARMGGLSGKILDAPPADMTAVKAGHVGTADPGLHSATSAGEAAEVNARLQSDAKKLVNKGRLRGIGIVSGLAGLYTATHLVSKGLFDTEMDPGNRAIYGLGGLVLGAFSAGLVSGGVKKGGEYIGKLGDKSARIITGLQVNSAVTSLVHTMNGRYSDSTRAYYSERAASDTLTLVSSSTLVFLGSTIGMFIGAAVGGRFWGVAGVDEGMKVGAGIGSAIAVGTQAYAMYAYNTVFSADLYRVSKEKRKAGKPLNLVERVNLKAVGDLSDDLLGLSKKVQSVPFLPSGISFLSESVRDFNVGLAGSFRKGAQQLLDSAGKAGYMDLLSGPKKVAAAALSIAADFLSSNYIESGLATDLLAGYRSFSAVHGMWQSYSPIFYGIASERGWMLVQGASEGDKQLGYTKEGFGQSLASIIAPELFGSYSNTGAGSSSNDNPLNMNFRSMYMAKPRTGGGNVSARRAFQFSEIPVVDGIIMEELKRRAIMYEVGVLGGTMSKRQSMLTGGWSTFATRSKTKPGQSPVASASVVREELAAQLLVSGSRNVAIPKFVARPVPTQYQNLVREASKRTGEAATLIEHFMRIESGGQGYSPYTVNPISGATGLMQIMPNIHNKSGRLDLFDPQTNILTGAAIMAEERRRITRRYGRPATDEEVAVAYNAGITVLYEAMDSKGKLQLDRLPSETRAYIGKLRYYKFIQGQRVVNGVDLSGYKGGNIEEFLQASGKLSKSEAASLAKRVRVSLAQRGVYNPYDDHQDYVKTDSHLGYVPTRRERAIMLQRAAAAVAGSPIGIPVVTAANLSYRKTGDFGEYRHGPTPHTHAGVDLQFFDPRTGSARVPVAAQSSGKVIEVRHASGYGTIVRTTSGFKYKGRAVELVYAHMHMADIVVQPGDIVKSGDMLGLQGNSGTSTGPTGLHVHLEFRVGGKAIDPKEIFGSVPAVAKDVPSIEAIDKALMSNKAAAAGNKGAYKSLLRDLGVNERVASKAEDFFRDYYTRVGFMKQSDLIPYRITLTNDVYTEAGERPESGSKKYMRDTDLPRGEGGEKLPTERSDADKVLGFLTSAFSVVSLALLARPISRYLNKFWQSTSEQDSIVDPSSVLEKPKDRGPSAKLQESVVKLAKNLNYRLENWVNVARSAGDLYDGTNKVDFGKGGYGTVSVISGVDPEGITVSSEAAAAFDDIMNYNQDRNKLADLRRRVKAIEAMQADPAVSKRQKKSNEKELAKSRVEIEAILGRKRGALANQVTLVSNTIVDVLESIIDRTKIVGAHYADDPDASDPGRLVKDYTKHTFDPNGSRLMYPQLVDGPLGAGVDSFTRASIKRAAALTARRSAFFGASWLNIASLGNFFGTNKTEFSDTAFKSAAAASQHLSAVLEKATTKGKGHPSVNHLAFKIQQMKDSGITDAGIIKRTLGITETQYIEAINSSKEARLGNLLKLMAGTTSGNDQLLQLSSEFIKIFGTAEGVDRGAAKSAILDILGDMYKALATIDSADINDFTLEAVDKSRVQTASVLVYGARVDNTVHFVTNETAKKSGRVSSVTLNDVGKAIIDRTIQRIGLALNDRSSGGTSPNRSPMPTVGDPPVTGTAPTPENLAKTAEVRDLLKSMTPQKSQPNTGLLDRLDETARTVEAQDLLKSMTPQRSQPNTGLLDRLDETARTVEAQDLLKSMTPQKSQPNTGLLDRLDETARTSRTAPTTENLVDTTEVRTSADLLDRLDEAAKTPRTVSTSVRLKGGLLLTSKTRLGSRTAVIEGGLTSWSPKQLPTGKVLRRTSSKTTGSPLSAMANVRPLAIGGFVMSIIGGINAARMEGTDRLVHGTAAAVMALTSAVDVASTFNRLPASKLVTGVAKNAGYLGALAGTAAEVYEGYKQYGQAKTFSQKAKAVSDAVGGVAGVAATVGTGTGLLMGATAVGAGLGLSGLGLGAFVAGTVLAGGYLIYSGVKSKVSAIGTASANIYERASKYLTKNSSYRTKSSNNKVVSIPKQAKPPTVNVNKGIPTFISPFGRSKGSYVDWSAESQSGQGTRKNLNQVTTIVLHSTDTPKKWKPESFLDKHANSPHFYISREGVTYYVMPVDRIGTHAGVSHYHGENGVNAFSIGIELERRVETAHGKVVFEDKDYPKAQIKAAETLVYSLVKQYRISPERITTHHEITSFRRAGQTLHRKVDPLYFPFDSFKEGIRLRANSTDIRPPVTAKNKDIIAKHYVEGSLRKGVYSPEGIKLSLVRGWNTETSAYKDKGSLLYFTGPMFEEKAGSVGYRANIVGDLYQNGKLERASKASAGFARARYHLKVDNSGVLSFGYGGIDSVNMSNLSFFVGGLGLVYNEDGPNPNYKDPYGASGFKQRFKGGILPRERMVVGKDRTGKFVVLRTGPMLQSSLPDFVRKHALVEAYYLDQGNKSRFVVPGKLNDVTQNNMPYMLRLELSNSTPSKVPTEAPSQEKVSKPATSETKQETPGLLDRIKAFFSGMNPFGRAKKQAIFTVDAKAQEKTKKASNDIPGTQTQAQRAVPVASTTASGGIVIQKQKGVKAGRQDVVDRDYHRQGKAGSKDIPNAGRRRPG